MVRPLLLWLLACQPTPPERIILIAIDTLRPDHLGLYGHSRDTSAPLDTWAKDAVVFEQARSVAPWTLPAMQSALTGRQPEQYSQSPTLPELLQAQGWQTAMIGANAYLTEAFSMNRGWNTHQVDPSSNATQQVDLALQWLANHPVKSMLLLHFIDAHLPYREPEPYRSRYPRTEEPGVLGKLARNRTGTQQTWTPAEQQYLQDRYDNSITYIHDQLQRLFSELTPRDMVVYFSDHGEEFFEHGGYEHGHTLHEELIRVPLIIKMPGLTHRKVSEPVSLLDITPTVLDALHLPYPGTSLLALAQGKADLQAARPIGFGRLLYGPQSWAVIQGNEKYTTGEGIESLYQLAENGEETKIPMTHKNVSSWQQRATEALGYPIIEGYRLVFVQNNTPLTEDLVVRVEVAGGVSSAWVADRVSTRQWVEISQEEATTQIRFRAGAAGSFEVFLNPNQPGTRLELQLPGTPPLSTVAAPRPEGGSRQPLLKVLLDETRTLSLKYSLHPAFPGHTAPPTSFDPETEQALRALGYL